MKTSSTTKTRPSRQRKACDSSNARTGSNQVSAVTAVLQLQGMVGNRATAQLLSAKLRTDNQATSSPAESRAEVEADTIADKVTGTDASVAGPVQPQDGQPSPQHASDVVRENGRPLPNDTRQNMEAKFGQDLNHVRIHTDQRANQSAERLNAQAYAVGDHIVFNKGQLAPETDQGRWLLAHELTHVLQPSLISSTVLSAKGKGKAQSERAEPKRARSRVSYYFRLAISGNLPSEDMLPEFLRQRFQPKSDEELQELLADWRVVGRLRVSRADEREGYKWIHVFSDPSVATPADLPASRNIIPEDSFSQLLSQIQELPPHIRNFLFDKHSNSPIDPRHYQSALRIAEKLKQLTPAELDHYKQQAKSFTNNWLAFEFSINDYIAKRARKLTPDQLIDEHDSLLNLREEPLGVELMLQASHGRFAFVQTAFSRLGSGNRDDVALHMIRAAKDRDLMQWQRSAEGSELLSRLFDELTAGRARDEEVLQATRILATKGSQEKVDAAASKGVKVFPYKNGGLFGGLTASPISAKRQPDGRIAVRLFISRGYSDLLKEAGLPWLRPRMELDEDEIIGVKMYDLGGEIHYRPALYLVQIANDSTTKTLTTAGEVALLGLSLGAGGVATTAGRAGWAARAAIWGDRAATAIGVLTMAIRDNRGWILSEFGSAGKSFLHYVDVVNSLTTLYSGGRIVWHGSKALAGLRRSSRDWNDAANSQWANLADDQKRLVAEIKRETDEALQSISNAERAQAQVKKLSGGAGVPPKPPKPIAGGTGGSGGPKPTKEGTSSPKYSSIPTKGSKGNQAKSVRDAERKAPGGSRGPARRKPLNARQREMRDELMKEHSVDGPPLRSEVAEDAIIGAELVKGSSGKGADVVLHNGGGREVAVFSGRFDARTLGGKLVEEGSQQGVTEIFLQISSPGASREQLIKLVTTGAEGLAPIRRGYPTLAGVNIKFYGPSGQIWWNGKFFGPK